MANDKELKSCIIGQAQVIFGGGVSVDLGTVGDRKDAFAIGLSEFKHPAQKAGDVPPSMETFGIQVSLVFPNLDTLRNFREILDQLEAELKTKIKESEAQQQIDFPPTNDQPSPNPLLGKKLTDCNLSVRTLSICKANGIDTLGDLVKLHKTDWIKFRNGGKKSLAELDDLLTENGLEWAKYE